jgi:signal peptidase II
MKGPKVSFLIPLGILFFDQWTKGIIAQRLTVGESIPVIKNVLYFTYTKNSGIAFGLFQGTNPLLVLVILFALGLIIYFYLKLKVKSFLVGLPYLLIIGGASGNLLDRVIWGEVRDFIDFRIWPIFNLADTTITLGIFLFIYNWFRTPRESQ